MENSFPGSSGGNAGRSFFVLSNQDPSGHDCINTQSAQDPGRLSARSHRNTLRWTEAGRMIKMPANHDIVL